MISVFDYQNYRHFLADFLQDKRVSEKGFSQREILRHMGINSTGFLSNVIAGRNNLTTTQIAAIIQALRLKKDDASYFESMVLFTQARTVSEKNLYFSRMLHQYRLKFKSLKPGQLTFFAKWHYPVIREIINIIEFRDDFKNLAHLVDPQITPAEAKEAIEELEAIGLIEKDQTGVYRQKNQTITTGDEVSSLHVSQFIMETMKNAQRSIDVIPSNERDLSVLTLRLSESTMQKIKTEIQLFRKKLLQMEADDTDQDRVYQCNINFFPVSKRKGEKDGTI